MSEAVRLMVETTIHDGELQAFQDIARQMTELSRQEPGTLGYEWYFRKDNKVCRLLEKYASADALLSHIGGPVVQQYLPRLLEHAKVERIEVYGDPGAQAAERLAQLGTQFFTHGMGIEKSH